MPESFSFRLVGTSGCEILADGKVVAWTTNGYWAAIIVAVLDGAEEGVPTYDERNPSALE
jgi:hypothetical protein